eukprot:PRCOL_00002575-RA
MQNAPVVKVEGPAPAYVSRAVEEGDCLGTTHLEGFGARTEGKVRDTYYAGDDGLFTIVTTDRQSAFDRILASIPFKGQVLNGVARWWFDQTQDIVPNALLSTPHPNVSVMKKCEVFPVEFVMRGFITGSTSTSLWTHYNNGEREYCGNSFPDGLRKNDQLSEPVLTPTTKAADHDEPISLEGVIERGLMSREDAEETARLAKELFKRGQEVAASKGFLLVDTKYEFGKDADGTIRVVDEVHTPDSSRYWLAHSYEERHAAGEEPENIDKEFLRLWFAANCDPYNDETLPEAPVELVTELSRRYVLLYESITGETFVPVGGVTDADISAALKDSGHFS